MTVQLTLGRHSLQLAWPDGVTGLFPHIWLRDADPAGFHPITAERLFDLTSVPLDIAPEDVTLDTDALVLRWPGAETPSRMTLDWLREHRPGARRHDPAEVAPVTWTANLGEDGIPRASATDLLTSDEALAAWLADAKRYGLALVTDMADDREAGLNVARHIGFLRETNFGESFEVISKPDPNNLAYTAEALPLHTDLTNQEIAPGFQFLHCIANGALGGGSVFCDGFAVAEALKDQDPEAFETLTRVAVPFRFHDAQTDIRARKTVIVLDSYGAVSEICFNAHLADLVDLPPEDTAPFYRVYRAYMALTRDPAFNLITRLAGGEMVVFDNRRVLHGREAFDPSTGNRHLRGCYVDRGEWDSRMRVLARG